jgi:predicted nuclease of restriction endonuclease-like (RecB) superfamily
MKDIITKDESYLNALEAIKSQVTASRHKAALSVNSELIKLYYSIGQAILTQQKNANWGAKVIDTLAVDLKTNFSDMKGLSPRNLKYMRKFAHSWDDFEFVQQAVAQIPWGHNIVILDKLTDQKCREWYIKKCIEHGWSRNVLVHQIESKLIVRQGNAVTNFKDVLASPKSELAQQTFKSPYIFDFLSLSDDSLERKIENALVEHVTKFLLELGRGFAFVGKQVKLEVEGDEFYIDLLFYHIHLRCYVVIELKAGDFKPEHAGQLNFYLNIVDEQMKREGDSPTIGLLLCKNRNKIVAEYALRNNTNPIGIAEYQIDDKLPKEIAEQLPAIAQLIGDISLNIKEEE